MAKQTINIGTSANSGTGDPLRTAFTKSNENFTELYNRTVFSGSYADLSNKPTLFSGSYNDLTNKPTIPTDVNQLADAGGLLGGSADLGDFKISGSALGTKAVEGDGWGGYSMYLSPNGEGASYIGIPNDASATDGGYLTIANYPTTSGGVRIEASTNYWTFNPNGDLTAPGDIITGTVGGRFIQDCDDGTTSIRWTNVSLGSNNTQLIRAYTGDPNLDTERERAQIKLNWLGEEGSETQSGLTIRSFDHTDPVSEVNHNWEFKGDGVLQLPQGGIIAETSITNNPTIVIAPAMAAVESQVLFIKGGAPGYINTQNGISIQTLYNQYAIGDTASFNIWTPDNSNLTLYWWLEPAGGGVAPITPVSGTVLINEFGASDVSIDVEVLSTAPFRIYVGPTDGVTATAGVSVSINDEVATDYHLHLTTGDLTETSIIVGTDDHNVRTTADGGVEINTFLYPDGGGSAKWIFDNNGALTLPSGSPVLFGNGNSRIQAGMGFHINSEEGISLEAVDVTDPLNPITNGWYFSPDGTLTFPDTTVQTTAYAGTGAITFTGNEIQGNTFGGAGTLITKTVDNTGDNYSTGSGSIGFLNFGTDGNIQNVKAGWTVTFASGETRTVSLDAWQPLGTYWNISFDSAYTWSAGDVMPVTFSSPDYAAGTDPQVTLTAGTESWTFDENGSITFPDTTVQTTAWTGVVTNTTVAKTGGNSNPQGNVVTVTLSPTTAAWTNGTYFVGSGGIDINVTVLNGNMTLNSVSGTGGTFRVGDAVVFDGGLFGGQPTTDDVTLTVDTITTAPTYTAIDLTKTINKLANGAYTLADGTEGQIMYLVPQGTATDISSIEILVSYARVGTTVYTNYPLFFNSNVITLIFTDDAWQQSGGGWD